MEEEDFLAPLKLYGKERIQRKDGKKGEMTVLLLSMLLIWRSWQKAGRQRGRVSGALTQSQETESGCHPVPASGPATVSLRLTPPSAHEGPRGESPSPAPPALRVWDSI